METFCVILLIISGFASMALFFITFSFIIGGNQDMIGFSLIAFGISLFLFSWGFLFYFGGKAKVKREAIKAGVAEYRISADKEGNVSTDFVFKGVENSNE